MKYSNPVMPGFYPDPSICRYRNMYYMVNSTFQYFPGVVLSESSDLINWKQIGYVLTRESQLPLSKAGRSGGIFAPTIRCENGRFYMVTTNVSAFGNFYVWTDDIHGEWSEPILVEQDGIDPSLYFEGNKCYFMSNGTDDDGEGGIVQCEIDIVSGKKLTPSRCIWKGNGGRYLEGPHLYKINNNYYLLAAEGGTEYGHMIICAKGSTPYGPFLGDPGNPVLTNRNLGGYQIQGCGHGDLVEDGNGDWWMVHLGFRQTGIWSMYHITGRETYLVPVAFDNNGWMHAGDNGTTRSEVEIDRISGDIRQNKNFKLTFNNTRAGVQWCYLRNPHFENYITTQTSLKLYATDENINDDISTPSFTAMRQLEMEGSIACSVLLEEQEAGISIYMDQMHHYDVFVCKNDVGFFICKRVRIGDISYIQQRIKINSEHAVLCRFRIMLTPERYEFRASCMGIEYDLGTNQTKYVSTEVAEGFTGVMIALYAQNTKADWSIGHGNNENRELSGKCNKPAVFTEFEYTNQMI